MYIRVTRTVQDRGVLVRPVDLEKTVTDRQVDWYASTFTFGEDALEYWESNNDSIKGYNGEVFTSTLYWDLDCKQDFGKAKKAALDLYAKLETLGLSDGVEIYFSGNKGFHLLLHTKQKFSPIETSTICYNVAMEAGVPAEVFDTSVYNITRIFRVKNTKHQESALYKIPVLLEELQELKEKDIREMAKEPRFEEVDFKDIDATSIKDTYSKKVEIAKSVTSNVTQLRQKGDPASPSPDIKYEMSSKVDFSMCPPGHRRCIYALEQGDFGPSERHSAILRLAAYYRGQGYSRKHADNLIGEALHFRSLIHPDTKAPNMEECNRDVNEVYSDEWKGGTFTCKTDLYLQSKCDHGNGPCHDDAKVKIRNVLSIDQLSNNYIKQGEEALANYPKFGIDWLDNRVRLRPKNVSVLAGANGSGKTSLAIQLIDNLNKQKMFHVIFSLDMADSSLFEKLGAKYTGYSQTQIEKAFNVNTFDEDMVQEVTVALKENLPYTLFDFTSSATMTYIEQTLMGLKQVYENLQLAVIDYAGRILGEFDNQYANSTHNAIMSNDVAKRTRTHLLFLSQVSRENGDHTDPLRSSRVSKDSGSWEENATVVMTMWRPFGSGLMGADAYAHIYIAKNRSGSLGENVFNWDGKSGNFSEMKTEKEFEKYRILCEQNEMDPPKFNWFVAEDAREVTDSRFSPEIPKSRFNYEPSGGPVSEIPPKERVERSDRDEGYGAAAPERHDEKELPNNRPGKFRLPKRSTG